MKESEQNVEKKTRKEAEEEEGEEEKYEMLESVKEKRFCWCKTATAENVLL